MNGFQRESVLTFVHFSFRTFPSMSRLSLFLSRSALVATLFACVPLSHAADTKAPDQAPASTNKPPEVSIFADKRLEDAVRQQVFAKRYTNSPLTAADVANVSTFNGNGKGITSLAGLEHCKALAAVDLAGNAITDLAPLKGLKQLQYLNVATNKLKTIVPLATLPALQYIEISENQVADLAPTYLFLDDNRIRDLTPLNTWITGDLNGAKNFAPFVNLYLHGNRLNAKSRQLLSEWKKAGVRVNE
jgi:Leucine-rich repeat (LRR) protein